MKSTVYALAESAFFRLSPYHYVLVALAVVHLVRVLLNRAKFVRSVAWIPGPKALPVVGNALSLTVEQDEFYRILLRCGQDYGRVFRLWIGMRPFVFLSRAEDIQPILNSLQHIDKSVEYSFLRDWLGEGLLTATGVKWQKRRKMLTPCFHWDMLAEFAEPIERQVDILVDILSDFSKKQKEFNILAPLKLCTLDIICVTAMGKEVGAQRHGNDDYVTAVERMSRVLVRRFITPWLKPDLLFNLSSIGKTQAKALPVINQFVSEVIQAKKEEKKAKVLNINSNGVTGHHQKRKAFLDLLLEAIENGADFTDKDLVDEVNTFMFAGHDTTATAVSWCLYVLGKQPEAQERIVQEYRDETQNGESIYQNLKNLHYLEMCIKEAMRLYPVTPLIARDIKHTVNLPGGRVLPAGVTALIHSPMLHRDPTYFPDPDTFKPERFQDANPNRHAFAYIPFSAGPRNCIGQRFAQMNTKLIVAKILEAFHVVSVVPEDKLNLVSDIVLNNKEGINIVLTERE